MLKTGASNKPVKSAAVYRLRLTNISKKHKKTPYQKIQSLVTNTFYRPGLGPLAAARFLALRKVLLNKKPEVVRKSRHAKKAAATIAAPDASASSKTKIEAK